MTAEEIAEGVELADAHFAAVDRQDWRTRTRRVLPGSATNPGAGGGAGPGLIARLFERRSRLIGPAESGNLGGRAAGWRPR